MSPAWHVWFVDWLGLMARNSTKCTASNLRQEPDAMHGGKKVVLPLRFIPLPPLCHQQHIQVKKQGLHPYCPWQVRVLLRNISKKQDKIYILFADMELFCKKPHGGKSGERHTQHFIPLYSSTRLRRHRKSELQRAEKL